MTTATLIQAELAPNEQLLWSGQPRQGWLWPKTPAAWFWTLGPLVGMVGFLLLTGGGNPILIILLDVLVVGAPLFTIGYRFWAEARQRAHTHYALTNERVLILCDTAPTHLRTLPLKTLTEIQLTLQANGVGDIHFNPGTTSTRWFLETPQTAAFADLPNAREVYDRLRQAQRAAHSSVL